MQITLAKIDITPEKPAPIAGTVGRREPYKRIHDRLELNAALFSSSGKRVLIVSADLLYIGQNLQKCLEDLAQAHLQIPAEAVFLFASHTHFAPATDRSKPRLGQVSDVYMDYVCKKSTELILGLCRAGQSLTVRRGQTNFDGSINRRRHWPYPVITPSGLQLGRTVLAPNPDGPNDTRVHVYWLIDVHGGIAGCIWSYACHPVCFPHNDSVSSDFPGVVRAAIRADVGDDIPVIFMQGFSGDIRPRAPASSGLLNLVKTAAIGPRFGLQDYTDWKNWSDLLAGKVLGTRTQADICCWEQVQYAQSDIELTDLLTGENPTRRLAIRQVSLGTGISFLSMSAEVVSIFGKLLGSETVPVGCEGDTFGYLPTNDMVKEGGYEGGEFLPVFSLRGKFKSGLNQKIHHAIGACGIPDGRSDWK